MSPDDLLRIRRVADRLRALADETRIRLILHLMQGEQGVGNLAGLVGISQPSCSKHLAILRDAGLVRMERDGNSVRCSCRDQDDLKALCSLVCTGVERFITEEHAPLVNH